MNQKNNYDNSKFHQIKKQLGESVVACVELTLKKQKA